MNIQKVGDRIINIPRKTCLSPCGPEGNGILCYTASSLPLNFFYVFPQFVKQQPLQKIRLIFYLS